MPQQPSQPCRACASRGWVYGPERHVSGTDLRECPTCGGKGRVTITAARALNWRPIVHGERRKPPMKAAPLPFEKAPKLAGLSNSLQVTSILRREA